MRWSDRKERRKARGSPARRGRQPARHGTCGDARAGPGGAGGAARADPGARRGGGTGRTATTPSPVRWQPPLVRTRRRDRRGGARRRSGDPGRGRYRPRRCGRRDLVELARAPGERGSRSAASLCSRRLPQRTRRAPATSRNGSRHRRPLRLRRRPQPARTPARRHAPAPRRCPRRTAPRTTPRASSFTSTIPTSCRRPCRARSAPPARSAATSPTSTTARAARRTARRPLPCACLSAAFRPLSPASHSSGRSSSNRRRSSTCRAGSTGSPRTSSGGATGSPSSRPSSRTRRSARQSATGSRRGSSRRSAGWPTRPGKRAAVLRQSRFAKLDLAFTTEKSNEPAPPPSELRSTLDDAIGILAAELGVLLFVLIAGAPFIALAILGWLGARALRRGATQRVLERA